MAETTRRTAEATERSKQARVHTEAKQSLKSLISTCKRRSGIGCGGSFCKLRDAYARCRPHSATNSPPERCKRRASFGSQSSGGESLKKTPFGESNSNPPVSNSLSPRSPAASVAASTVASPSPLGGSFRGMPLGRLSVCYECHMVVDPINGTPRYSSVRATASTCPDCGEIFMKADSLENHRAVRHAVSELGAEDTSRKIVEIIFQSSWLKRQAPACRIERVLKVHNAPKTKARFEDYRDTVKNKAGKLGKKHPRSSADGNELLRFHCTTFACSLGLRGSPIGALCESIPRCGLCSIIRDGFKEDALGRIRTMSTSGKAHEAAAGIKPEAGGGIAMLVCRVIAGRVRRSSHDGGEDYDSVATAADELFVFTPKAILPCFVVIYTCC